ncbi:MAG: aminoglycoside phosphotransferase family protein, partial [Dehalococcoidia bacterium]
RGVNLPRPLGFISSLHLSLQEYVPGAPLRRLVDTPDFLERVKQAASSIATIHRTEVPAIRQRTTGRVLESLAGRVAIVSELQPDLGRQFHELTADLFPEVERHTEIRGPVHRDFHLGNVLVDKDRLTLIDWDRTCHGDSLLDVGHFLASLQRVSLRNKGSVSALAEAKQGFLEEYLNHSQERENRVSLFEALFLVSEASYALRSSKQTPTLHEDVQALLEQGARLLDSARKSPAVTVEADISRQVPAPINRAHWAADTTYLRALLDGPIRSAYAAEVTDCQLIQRARSPRDHQLRYQVSGQKNQQEWQVGLTGLIPNQPGGLESQQVDAFSYLQAAYGDLSANPEAPTLPRPIACIAAIGLRVWEEPPRGRPFATLLASAEGPATAAKIGRALAAMQTAPVIDPETMGLEAHLQALSRQVECLASAWPDAAHQACFLLDETETRLRRLDPQATLTLGQLRPEGISLVDGRVAFNEVGGLAIGHPLVDAAEFLVRLTRAAMKDARVRPTVSYFREAYIAAAGVDPEEFSVFEAAALILQTSEEPGDRTLDLLDLAVERLAVRPRVELSR